MSAAMTGLQTDQSEGSRNDAGKTLVVTLTPCRCMMGVVVSQLAFFRMSDHMLRDEGLHLTAAVRLLSSDHSKLVAELWLVTAPCFDLWPQDSQPDSDFDAAVRTCSYSPCDVFTQDTWWISCSSQVSSDEVDQWKTSCWMSTRVFVTHHRRRSRVCSSLQQTQSHSVFPGWLECITFSVRWGRTGTSGGCTYVFYTTVTCPRADGWFYIWWIVYILIRVRRFWALHCWVTKKQIKSLFIQKHDSSVSCPTEPAMCIKY